MKRLLFLSAAGLTVVALAGAVGLPDLAGAQDATTTDSITVNGVGSVDAVPNEAKMSFGAETRRDTAQAAVAANGDAMRKILNALRQAGGRDLATQWVSVYPYTDEVGQVNGYVASNSVSAVSDVGDAPALIDAATGAGANQITGPGLSSSNAEALYRQALGGRGYMLENPAARFFRELRVDRIWEGTSEIQRSIISRGVFTRGAAPYLGWDPEDP